MALSPFGLALSCSAVISAGLAVLAWHKRAEPGARPLAVFHVALAVGTGAYAIDVVSTSLGTQLFWMQVWLVGQALTATTWVYVAIEYTGHERWASPRTAALLAAEPAAFAVAVFVPQLRELVFEVSASEGVQGSIFYRAVDPAAPAFAHYLYLFAVALVGSLLFVRLFVRSRHLYRTQATAVLVAAVAPWTTLLVQTIGLAPNEDPSVFTWAVSGMALTVGLFRFKTLDPVPTARESIVEEMGDGVVVLDEDDVVGEVNPAARRLLSRGGGDPVGDPVEAVFDGWDRVEYDSEGPSDWQELSLSVDGERRFVEVQVSPFRDRFDRLVGRLVVLRDVTERKRREQDLARYKTIFESVRDPVYVLDADGRFVMVNEPFVALSGRDRDELVGTPFSSVLAGGAPPSVDGEATEEFVEVDLETGDGTVIPCETRRAPISFEGESGGSVGFLRDISRRKRIQSELVETTERFETLVEASPLAIVAVDTEGVVEVWNPAAEDLFGYDAGDVVGDPLPIVPDDRAEAVRRAHERVLDGERMTGVEVSLERRDGSLVDTSVSIAPVHDAEGAVRGTVSVLSDITERKERERKLQRQNERLDEFASIVSHDLRNPLQVAAGSVDLAAETGDLELLAEARDALERMDELVEDTLALARQGSDIEGTEPVAFDRAVRRAWANVATPGATLELEPAPARIEADEPRLVELLENLFRNSVEHSSTSPRSHTREDAVEHGSPDSPSPSEDPAGPKPERTADGGGGTTPDRDPDDRRVSAGERSLTVTVGWADRIDGFYVADDGPGFPDDVEIFESGVTTSEDGTGFGLAIVQRIAEAHGWTVTATESADGGARVEVHGVEPITDE